MPKAIDIGEFGQGDDGYFYWWPPYPCFGCLSAHELRKIADNLDKLNKDWDTEVAQNLVRNKHGSQDHSG